MKNHHGKLSNRLNTFLTDKEDLVGMLIEDRVAESIVVVVVGRKVGCQEQRHIWCANAGNNKVKSLIYFGVENVIYLKNCCLC